MRPVELHNHPDSAEEAELWDFPSRIPSEAMREAGTEPTQPLPRPQKTRTLTSDCRTPVPAHCSRTSSLLPCPFGRCPPKERSFQARPVQALPGKLLKAIIPYEVEARCEPSRPRSGLFSYYTFNYTPFPQKVNGLWLTKIRSYYMLKSRVVRLRPQVQPLRQSSGGGRVNFAIFHNLKAFCSRSLCVVFTKD